ncbi:MAG TPA: hypothetical protein VN700_09290 [Vicinamibacterales bacterium]|nr:hypothetical protein [Vicinamibacterales bacterium]
MTTISELGGLFVLLSALMTPLLYAIYKGHDVSFHLHLRRRNRRR